MEDNSRMPSARRSWSDAVRAKTYFSRHLAINMQGIFETAPSPKVWRSSQARILLQSSSSMTLWLSMGARVGLPSRKSSFCKRAIKCLRNQSHQFKIQQGRRTNTDRMLSQRTPCSLTSRKSLRISLSCHHSLLDTICRKSSCQWQLSPEQRGKPQQPRLR